MDNWNVGPIRVGDRKNFDTLKLAASNGDLALVSAKRKSDGAQVALVTAISRDGGEFVMTPLAVMIEGNPYDDFEPPSCG